MTNGRTTLAERLKASKARIAEWKQQLGILETSAEPAGAEHTSKQKCEDDSDATRAASSSNSSGQPVLPTARTPYSSSRAQTGTQEDPLEISDTDEQQERTITPETRTNSVVCDSRDCPPDAHGTTHRLNELDVIELTDSEPASVVEEPPVKKTNKRRHEPPKPSAESDPAVKSEETVLSATSRRKQRKQNHATEGDVKPFSDLPSAVKKESYTQLERRKRLRKTYVPEIAKEEEKAVLPALADQVPIEDVAPPEALKHEDIDLGTDLDELKLSIHNLSNPKAEIKREYQLKDEDLLQLHLPHRTALRPYPIPLPQPLLSITVRREQLAQRYGGSAMDTFPRPSAAKRAQRHARAHLMCINLLWNPHAPQRPGHAGLYFDTILPGDPWVSAGGVHSERQTLFVKLRAGKWLYLGEYEARDASSLTSKQWCNLANAVRATWTKNISEKDWGKTLRARIHLRRTLGREPTREDVRNAEGSFKHVTPEQVNDAMVAGHERIHVWSIKCVGYDEDFQRELIQLARGEI